MNVVVVESPAKAKTIEKYLGGDYTVLASYGHVRDLLDEDGAVEPDKDFEMHWRLLEQKKRALDEITRAAKQARKLILATDPDREGEAISWHLLQVLADRKALDRLDVQRAVFHEITRPAVTEAIAHARSLDEHLIDAYRARRALDYLVGFTLSPVLWRKLQGSKSAGRVQSVALRLICEREAEIEAFRPQEYWTVEALLETPEGRSFKARLFQLEGKRLDKFALRDEASARAAVREIEARALAVDAVEKKQVSRNPAPPFSTSTLQQEASRKLGFSADRTMKTAQRLFEGVDLGGETVGLITYMRTDSVQLSGEALGAARRLIGSRFGEAYLPEKPRQYKTKTKNAQEAHEAVRPTDMFRLPSEVGRYLEDDQRRLYDLIWKRTVASQMAAALLDRVIVDIGSSDAAVGLRATGQTVAFDGFLKLYQEGRDDIPQDEAEEDGAILPPLKVADPLKQREVTPNQHFTEPPPRYTEASLVKRLEELGIGRPSTYAAIISVLQARDYVRLEAKRFVPEDRGRIVNAFLVSFFDRYVQPGFTADLEDKLDEVASGERFWKEVLREFWDPFESKVGEVKERRVAEVIDALNEAMAVKLFPPREDGGDPRLCPVCGNGQLSLKLGRFGAFVGCSNYPECRYTRQLGNGQDQGNGESKDRLLGVDPGSREEVWLKNGRFGPYVQRGSGTEAKRSSLPPGLGLDDLDLQTALQLLALPREVGTDPETKKPVMAGINRFGPFVQLEKKFVRLEPGDDVLTVGMNRALALLNEPAKGRRQAAPAAPLRELGAHPDDGQPIQVFAGRFGPYVKHGQLNASLPKAVTPEALTVAQALEILAARAERLKQTGGKPVKKGKAPAKKAAEPAAAPRKAAAPAARRAKPAAAAKAAPAKKPAPAKKAAAAEAPASTTRKRS